MDQHASFYPLFSPLSCLGHDGLQPETNGLSQGSEATFHLKGGGYEVKCFQAKEAEREGRKAWVLGGITENLHWP
jgi:hypothetical protein